MPDPLRPLLNMDGDPVFEEPWQAQALGMADSLVRAGVFSATDWAEALGAARTVQGDQPDTIKTYYLAVLDALEGLLAERDVAPEVLLDAKKAWETAYKSTPHGQPVLLPD